MTASPSPARAIPAVGRPRPIRVPRVAERVLPNGVRVIAARRTGVPRFELRLRIPNTGASGGNARQAVLAETLLSGTPELTSVALVEAFQRLGGGLAAAADADWLTLAGSALSTAVPQFLVLLNEVLTEACFPAGEVSVHRDRLVQEIRLARSQPDTLARDALLERLWGRHPYGRGTPRAEVVASVSAASLRKVHQAWVLPAGSVLVLVGDCTPAQVLDQVEGALGSWIGTAPAGQRPSAPAFGPFRSALVVDRPGAVQTNIRLAGPAVPRRDARFPALVLANAVYGGYFTSRLVDNIRERRGYTYSPGSAIEHRQLASAIFVSADVGTDVTAAALLETRYELGRMVTTAVDQDELDAARRYLLGTMAMSLQTQAGLTSYLAMLAGQGLDVSYLQAYPAALQRVTVDDVRAAATAHLAPRSLVTVMVGDAGRIAPQLEAFDEVEIRPAAIA